MLTNCCFSLWYMSENVFQSYFSAFFFRIWYAIMVRENIYFFSKFQFNIKYDQINLKSLIFLFSQVEQAFI